MNDRDLSPLERRRRRKQLLYQRTAKIYTRITVIFLACLALAAAANLIKKDRAYSETENRMLAQRPRFSIKSITEGDFMSDMESYVTDQFIGRDSWIRIKTSVDKALGKRESNGVYIGKQDYLMEIPAAPNEEALADNLKAIQDFSSSHQDLNTVMTLVPNAAYVCSQYLPPHAPVRDQAQDIARVREAVDGSLNYVDLTETLMAHNTESLYYKTDHHWTSLAARYAFDALWEPLGIDSPTEKYTVYPVTNRFSGTLSAKTGYNKAKDTIEIYVPQGVNSEYVVTYVEEGRKSATIYDSASLKNRDQYEVFFGGNHSRIDIRTPLTSKKSLLLFKDSYANCFLQFLVPYYRNIIVVDPRYYYDDIDRLISDNAISDVLFLYNVDTFLTDTSLADALAPSETEAGTEESSETDEPSTEEASGTDETNIEDAA